MLCTTAEEAPGCSGVGLDFGLSSNAFHGLIQSHILDLDPNIKVHVCDFKSLLFTDSNAALSLHVFERLRCRSSTIVEVVVT